MLSQEDQLTLNTLNSELEKQPNDIKLLQERGNFLLQSDPKLAYRDFRKAADLEPNSAERVYDVGRALAKMEEYVRAYMTFDRALELTKNPLICQAIRKDRANVSIVLGFDDLKNQDVESAQRTFQNALKIIPNHPGALNGLGSVYLKQRRFALAMEYFTKITPENQPDPFAIASVHLGLASCLTGLGLFNSADKAIDKAEAIINGSDQHDLGKAFMLMDVAGSRDANAEARNTARPVHNFPLNLPPQTLFGMNNPQAILEGEVDHADLVDGLQDQNTPR